MNERLKVLRIRLNLTQQEFADRLGTSRNNIAGYEIGRRSPSDAVVSLICKEFRVDENWLRTGEGNIFLPLPEEDEIAACFSEIMEDTGNNLLYVVIKEFVYTYNKLTPSSQELLREFMKNWFLNIKEKEG